MAASLALCAGALGACGSSSGSGSPSSAVAATCRSVAAALTNGPTPAADPVGYAEAQVLPLRQIHTNDAALQADIDRLAAAEQALYQSNGSAHSKAAVERAGKVLDAVCPGAFT